MSNWEKYLEKIYFNPSHPASYEGPVRLYKYVKQEGKYKISHNQIKNGYKNKNLIVEIKELKENSKEEECLLQELMTNLMQIWLPSYYMQMKMMVINIYW